MAMHNRVLVIGAGEVGNAMGEVMRCEVRDIDPVLFHEKFHLLVIAFPWFDGFEEAVLDYAEQHLADGGAILVASTVPVGTCDKHGWAHMLTRGRHPNLAESFKEAVIRVSGQWSSSHAAVGVMLQSGLSARVISETARTTELAKLVELAQFGVEVSMMHEVKRLTEQYDVSFEDVYTQSGLDYNMLYAALGQGHLRKPVLEYQEGPIGGHCVSPGIELLDDDWFLRATEGHRP